MSPLKLEDNLALRLHYIATVSVCHQRTWQSGGGGGGKKLRCQWI